MTLSTIDIKRIAKGLTAWLEDLIDAHTVRNESGRTEFDRMSTDELQLFIFPVIDAASRLGNLELLATPAAVTALNGTLELELAQGWRQVAADTTTVMMNRDAGAFLISREVVRQIRRRQKARRRARLGDAS